MYTGLRKRNGMRQVMHPRTGYGRYKFVAPDNEEITWCKRSVEDRARGGELWIALKVKAASSSFRKRGFGGLPTEEAEKYAGHEPVKNESGFPRRW
ncbi:MAG: hypothetical protein M1835_006978 [Candelina submexicana]|nr:MAG: hypothetical protein M1835_006978 [Candelina submexicana]